MSIRQEVSIFTSLRPDERGIYAIYTCGNDGIESIYPDRLNRKALEKYAESEARRRNNAIVRDYVLLFTLRRIYRTI